MSGYLFTDQLRALERALKMESGLRFSVEDTASIDGPQFHVFVDSLLELLDSTNNGPLFAMASGCAAVAIALNAKITGNWPDVQGQALPIVERAHHVMAALWILRDHPDGGYYREYPQRARDDEP